MRADRFLTAAQKKQPLSDKEVAELWTQFTEAYDDAQRSYDTSVRALAAGGIAVSATLAAAFDGLGAWGTWAVWLFGASLLLNTFSYWTAQRDVMKRLSDLGERKRAPEYGNWLTTFTTALNIAAGLALVIAGGCLAAYATTID